uniref:Sialin n=1 Tax=Cacopsylla melanoneura TaxID=428564 RepID=A0A8D8TK43_9HEMI
MALSDSLTCRGVLNIMVFFGFMVNYMFRVNLNIAIVDMIFVNNQTNPTTNLTNQMTNETIRRVIHDEDGNTRFTWSEYDKNFLIGSFFWGYLCTEIPGGRLAEIVGARRVFGYSMLLASLATLLSPLASKMHFYLIVLLRVVIGFMLGVTWPAMHPMAAKWIPPNERSKFISNMMASSLGAAFTLPICGFLIDAIGWESVFYFTGLTGLVWSILWFVLVFETPATHPRISVEEREYIETSIGFSATNHKVLRVPWIKIFTSPCVWAIIITHALSVFGYFTIVNQLPNYFKNILHFNIKENGLLSSLPFLGKYVTALLSSCLADYLRSTDRLTTTATRKLFTSFALLMPGILMSLQVYTGQDPVFAVAIFTLTLTFNGAVTAGYLGNGLDIAPNFSGTIFGFANTLSSFGGFVSSYLVGVLTDGDKVNNFGQWRYVFMILGATYSFGALVYLVFGTGKLQPWNTPLDSTKDVELSKKEAEPLKKIQS